MDRGSQVTMNDVLREFCSKNSRDYVDWSGMMDEAWLRLRKYGLTPLHHDGVHPNVFGNILLALSLLAKCDCEIKTYHALDAAFADLSEADYSRMNIAFRPSAERLHSVLADLAEIAERDAHPGRR